MSPAKVFLSYAHEDEALRRALGAHLKPLERQGAVVVWHDREIRAGVDWAKEIDGRLQEADVILLLVSPDFVASDYCYEIEMDRALARHRAGEARVVPVILRPCDWQGCPFAKLAALPVDGRAVTAADNRDAAFLEVAEGLRKVVEDLRERRSDALYAYLQGLLEDTAYINIRGIAPSSGHARGALRQPIETLYTPLRSLDPRIPRLGNVAEGDESTALDETWIERSVLLPELLGRHPRLLIEGQPGAGKTTFLRLVTSVLARDALGKPCPSGGSWRHRYLGLDDGGPAPTPIFLRLADLVPLLEKALTTRRDDRRWILDLLDELCRQNGYTVTHGRWRKILEQGTAWLLLDGLDEVADLGLRERLFAVFRDACENWRCPLVVASRPIRTEAFADMGFRVAVVEPFGDHDIRAFVERWVAALHGTDNESGEISRGGERYRTLLLDAIVTAPRVRRLATNPVMLTCLCVVHWNQGRLPEARSRVYRAVIDWLLAARRGQRAARGFDDRFALRALARLALAMLCADGGKRTTADLETGAEAVAEVAVRSFPELDVEERRFRAREWLRFECLGSGIVEEVTGNRVRFWHLTFQEFLVALQLAWRADGETDPDHDWWPVVRDHLGDVQWREVLALFPVCLFDEGGEGRVDKLLERVLALRGEDPDLATEARLAAVVARLVETLAVVGYKPRPELAEVHRQALERSLAIFTVEGATGVSVRDRIGVAEALGQGGDPRFANGRPQLLQVPGTDGARLGKYPVTVEEYQRFVDHRGYEESEHWSAEGWALRKKHGWAAPGDWPVQLETPNRPVVHVSWYEAQAYCKWLTVQRGGLAVRLPTEDEWFKAASPDGRTYPWGEAPEPQLVNFARTWGEYHVGSPTPVGVYPAGDGAAGHCDLAGNVWEWCVDEVPANEVPTPAKTHWKGRAEGAFKALRGGCWYGPADFLRTTRRFWYPADGRGGDVGFRLAASPPST